MPYLRIQFFVCLSCISTGIVVQATHAELDIPHRTDLSQSNQIEDQQRQLQEGSKAHRALQEQQLVDVADQLSQQQNVSQLNDLNKHSIPDTEEALTYAIFISINQQNWTAVRAYLIRYQQLPEYAEVIVLFTEGVLARSNGRTAEAVEKLQSMLKKDPSFSRGKLELARTSFENHQNKSSEQLFKELLLELPTELHPSIRLYLKALDQRKNWRSTFTLENVYDSNVNQRSEKLGCLSKLNTIEGDVCAVTADRGKIAQDFKWNINASLQKKLFIADHQALFLRASAFGGLHDTEKEFNRRYMSLEGGYQFQNARHDFSIYPLLGAYLPDTQDKYFNYGLGLGYALNINQRNNINLDISTQKNEFKQSNYQNNNGRLSNAYLTWSHFYGSSWMIFSGMTYTQKQMNDRSGSFDQKGFRAGIYKQFDNGSNAMFSVMYREAEYKSANVFIGPEPSKNKEQIYTLNYAMPNYSWKGISPALTYRFNQVESNNAWFYAYKGHELGFKLQKNW